MTKAQKLALRLSEIRQRLNEINRLEGDAYTDEIRTESDTLTTEFRDTETKWRAAVVAEGNEGEEREEPTQTQEERQFAELRGRCRLHEYVSAAIQQRSVEGAEAELNTEMGLRSTGAFPLEFLTRGLEERATTDAESATSQGTWLDRLMAGTAAANLGVTFSPVAPGVASYPVTTAGATAAQRGKEQAIADTAWTVGVTEAKPKRGGVRAVFSEEDTMRLPGLEAALERDLRAAVVEGMDLAIFKGDAGANPDGGDIAGLTTVADVTEKMLTQAKKVKAVDTLQTFSDLVDGIHAMGFGDLRVVSTVGAWRLWESTIANSAVDNQTLAAFLRAAGLSWTSRGDVESATTNGKFGAFVGLGRGIEGAAVAPVWNSAMLIRDPYSEAAKGKVAITLSYFWDFQVPRKANFARVKFGA